MKSSCLLLALCLILAPKLAAQDPLDIVATVPDLANLVEVIGGERVEVKTLVPPGNDPHSVLPKASLLLKLSRADGLILMGLDYEHAFLPALLEKTRNRQVLPGGVGYMNVGSRIHALNIPENLDRRQGADLHPRGNPHYNLDPENGRIMAQAARDLLQQLAPQWKEEFQQRWLAWDQEAQERIRHWQHWMEPLKGKKLLTYHDSWPYFAERYGLEIVTHVEPKPGLAPSAKHLLALKKQIEAEQISLLVMEPWYSESRVKSLVGKDVTLLKLSITSQGGDQSYLDFLESIVGRLRQAYGLPAKGESLPPQPAAKTLSTG